MGLHNLHASWTLDGMLTFDTKLALLDDLEILFDLLVVELLLCLVLSFLGHHHDVMGSELFWGLRLGIGGGFWGFFISVLISRSTLFIKALFFGWWDSRHSVDFTWWHGEG